MSVMRPKMLGKQQLSSSADLMPRGSSSGRSTPTPGSSTNGPHARFTLDTLGDSTSALPASPRVTSRPKSASTRTATAGAKDTNVKVVLHVRPQSQAEAAASSKIKVVVKSPQEPQAVVLGHQDVYTFDKYAICLARHTLIHGSLHHTSRTCCVLHAIACLQCCKAFVLKIVYTTYVLSVSHTT